MPKPTDTSLVVRHLPDTDPPQFQVQRLPDGKTGPPAVLPSPLGFPVAGRPDSHLLRELQWYLEVFLDYPFDPETDHAQRVQQALRAWGEQAFTALFGSREAGRLFDAATEDDYARLHLQVASDEPAVLAWPWEALYDPDAGRLAPACQIERRLNELRDPPKLPKKLPRDRVHILLVIARPFPGDVRFRSIARPLVELTARLGLPADIHVLRPPTFDQLREHLRQHPGHYHLLHFDGHGAYGPAAGAPAHANPHQLQGAEGRLIFETAQGKPDPVEAERLSELLREHAVPAVVLNACQSAMLDQRADDPFASVAAALLRAGMRGVVAMAYSLYVSGAQQFLPAFYRRLFDSGSLAQAVRAGRQEMRAHPGRVCARGTFPLDDWLVPVLYQQEAFDFAFTRKAKATPKRQSRLPAEARDERNPYRFVGRDGPLLALERALHRQPAGILVSGLGGVGKTTLVRGFLEWLEQTGGLGDGVCWLGFADVRSAEYVCNRLGEALFGPNFGALALGQKFEALVAVCHRQRLLLVWDNFESARGIAGTAVSAHLSEADSGLLRDLLVRLRGGPTKVLLTSRSTEDWLGPSNRYVLPLGGLDGEERWEFANAILSDLGKPADRADKELVPLMRLLNGHPLAMRVILPRLEKRTAAELTAALQGNFEALKLDTADEAEARLFATLQVAVQALPAAWQPLLVPLALHEGFVDGDYLEAMAQQVDAGWARSALDGCLQALVSAGLLRDLGQAVFEMHPALTGFLRWVGGQAAGEPLREGWTRAFVDVMGRVADGLAPRPLHEQRAGFFWHGANFRSAREAAQRAHLDQPYAELTQALAAYAQNTRDSQSAVQLFQEYADHSHRLGKEKLEAGALHQLGMIAAERRDFDAAEQLYRKSLAIKEKHGDEPYAASSYHQLGSIAEERRDFDAAEQWYRKALAIQEKHGNEPGAASTYHQLGRIAEERRDFDAAEQWYRKSLAISERLDIEQYAASTYHQLGRIAEERRDFDAAEQWYRKSLALSEKHGNEHGAAITYHQLGSIAEERRDFDAAEQWYRKALAIDEKHGNEHGAASTYGALGLLARRQGRVEEAGRWLLKAWAGFVRTNDAHQSQAAADAFRALHTAASADDRAKLRALAEAAGLTPLPEPPAPEAPAS
jgi:tetratricopeptide (TPR) repeat protein